MVGIHIKPCYLMQIGTAQNEQNNKPWTTPLVPGDQISDIIWRGSIYLGVLYLIHAWTIHKYVVEMSKKCLNRVGRLGLKCIFILGISLENHSV